MLQPCRERAFGARPEEDDDDEEGERHDRGEERQLEETLNQFETWRSATVSRRRRAGIRRERRARASQRSLPGGARAEGSAARLRGVRGAAGRCARPASRARRHQTEHEEEQGCEQLLLDAAADADAAAVLDDAVAAVAFAAAVVVSASDPGTLRLGGGVAAQWGETLHSAVLDGLARLLLEELVSRTRVELSELRERAPLLGLLQFAGVISPSGG